MSNPIKRLFFNLLTMIPAVRELEAERNIYATHLADYKDRYMETERECFTLILKLGKYEARRMADNERRKARHKLAKRKQIHIDPECEVKASYDPVQLFPRRH